MTDKKVGFWRIFWPSLVSAIVASIIGFLFFFGIIGSMFATEKEVLKSKTVLRMTLDGKVAEENKTRFDKSSFSIETKHGIGALLKGFEKAAEDDKISGVFLEIGELHCGYASVRELRKAINRFEEKGKFVIAYNSGEVITQKEYYLASAANESYGFPSSTMEFMGLGSELMFYKKTLELLDVEMQVIRGRNNDFKSAVEPYFRSEMSDSSRLQMTRLLTSIWKDIRQDISKDRKLDAKVLDQIAEDALIHRADDAVKHKLLDGVMYRDEVIQLVKKKAGIAKDKEIVFKSFEKYASKHFDMDQSITNENSPNIAVILAEGEVSTKGEGLSSAKICKLFQEVRKNKSIKTVVFRINSPGGSALASDEIWREVKLTNMTKKVIVSMGDVAASGGYYIAAPASTIFAEPTTITGSIGVFGVIPFTGKALENKLGFTFDRVSTNSHAVISTNRKLNESEFLIIQDEVDAIYDQFLARVSEGRGMTKEQVNTVARGRVWTGADAITIGLVDKLGGLDDAIEFAAKQMKIKEQKILYYPKKDQGKFDAILEQLGDDEEVQVALEKDEFDLKLALYIEQLKKLESISGIQMRLPFEFDLK